tara:strand:+ start:118 stop:351 length:234 start_codon:yes stop_codon:yes gene_type:complete
VSFLLSISDRTQQRGGAPSPISLAMSRLEFADYFGRTMETVGRTFIHLKGSGAIRLLLGNMLELVDTDTLQNMSDGI